MSVCLESHTTTGLVSADEIAAMLGVSKKVVFHMERVGKIPSVRMTTRSIRFDSEKVREALGMAQN